MVCVVPRNSFTHPKVGHEEFCGEGGGEEEEWFQNQFFKGK